MTFATSFQSAIRKLIDDFGNTVSLYSYSGVTKTENEEGDVTITDWKTATSTPAVDGDNRKEVLELAPMGKESVGDDTIIFRDDVTIAINDRVTKDSVNYRVDSIEPTRIQDTTVAQFVTISRASSTTYWG
jgi:hypothetical protein